MIKKVVVIGPESTGKSTLCSQLAEYYNTRWVSEYAREYLLKAGMDYRYEDLLTIAKGQLEREDEAVSTTNSQLVFVDTDMYVMKVWSEFVFGRCHQWILDQISERHYDLYLLCSTDLAWIKDELREYPDMESRLKLFHMYKDILVNQHVPWREITGSYEERLETAVKAVNGMLAQT